MQAQWMNVLADGLRCSRKSPQRSKSSYKSEKYNEKQLEEQAKLREHFETRLVGAKAAMKARYRANACPKERIENFKLGGLLGSGGYAEVYEVEHRRSRVLYALKVVKKNTRYERFNVRVIREKRITYAVQHQFIVNLHFVFQDYKYFYFFFDSAYFGSLHRVIQSIPYTESRVKSYAVQIILAVEYLHACDIVHRDLKPTNMLVFYDGYLKLSDFGFAKAINGRTNTGLGTKGYLAPEIAKLEPYGKGVDWWSFGVCLYEITYGERPFHESPFEKWSFPDRADTRAPVCRLIEGLLRETCSQRLGCLKGGAKQILKHEWFEDINVARVFEKKLVYFMRLAPLQPQQVGSYEFQRESEECDRRRKWYKAFCTK